MLPFPFFMALGKSNILIRNDEVFGRIAVEVSTAFFGHKTAVPTAKQRHDKVLDASAVGTVVHLTVIRRPNRFPVRNSFFPARLSALCGVTAQPFAASSFLASSKKAENAAASTARVRSVASMPRFVSASLD